MHVRDHTCIETIDSASRFKKIETLFGMCSLRSEINKCYHTSVQLKIVNLSGGVRMHAKTTN